MALSAKSIKDKVAAAVKVSEDMNEAKAGGYEAPAEGLAMLRFTSWIELGDHEQEFKGQKKTVWKAEATFELHGKKYPLDEFDGKKIAKRITVKLNIPGPGQKPSAKSAFYKLFKAMNYDNKATHIAEMLGNAYIGNVFHREYESNGEKRVAAQFRNPAVEESPLTIRAPIIEKVDDEGEVTVQTVKVPEQVNETRLFLWATPDSEQWDSIFIDGVYENKDEKGKVISTRSKNVWQETLKKALSFEGSELEALLLGDPDVGDVEDAAEAVKETKAKETPAKPQKGATKPSNKEGTTKGSGKKEKPAKDASKPSTKAVTENPLDALEDLDDDIPF